MAKTRVKKVVISGITSEQAEIAFSEFATADAKVQNIQSKMDMEITRIRDKYADEEKYEYGEPITDIARDEHLKIQMGFDIMNAGFDQVYNLYNPLVYSTGDIIDTWVYRAGLQNLQYSLATAVGLFKSVISLVLITVGYWLADKFTGYKLF